MERSNNFDAIRALANTPTGMTLGQLWYGDAVEARRSLDRVFGKGNPHLVVVEEFGGESEHDERKKLLAVTVSSIHETKLIALIYSGSTPNVLSSAVAERLSLDLVQSTKIVTVTDGSSSFVDGKLSKVPTMPDSNELYRHAAHSV